MTTTAQPQGVYQTADGRFVRAVTVGTNPEDGSPLVDIRGVCETCWKDIPRYVDAPGGYVSPESTVRVEANRTVAVSKIICLPCYQAVQAQISPNADLEGLRDLAHVDPAPAHDQ